MLAEWRRVHLTSTACLLLVIQEHAISERLTLHRLHLLLLGALPRLVLLTRPTRRRILRDPFEFIH